MQMIHGGQISGHEVERGKSGVDRTSTGARATGPEVPQRALTPEQIADRKIQMAESAKANMLPITGKLKSGRRSCATAIIDESYLVVGAHVDETTYMKIQKGEYVDFSKLIPRDQVLVEEDQRLEIVIRGGRTYYVPVSEGTNITSFQRWEQAFRVFCNIYTKFHPHRASELIEYNHIIHTVSSCYSWENVYMYDKDFRMHMARNPQRNWGMIFQQAWSLRLKDRLPQGQSFSNSGTNQNKNSQEGMSNNRTSDPCRRFNRGHCQYGANCHFEHRCSYCLKFGHCVLFCRKLQADKEKEKARNNASRNGNKDRENGHQGGSAVNNSNNK